MILLSFGTTVALTPAFAAGGGAGGGGSGGGAATTCPKGQVYSPKKKKCVQMKSEIVPDDALTDYAFALAREKRSTRRSTPSIWCRMPTLRRL